ncbi:MAG: hypothetical protein AAGI46_00730 [Planctomycetota bacterium]
MTMETDEPLPCPNCGYDLRGNASDVCPECGDAFDPARLAEAQIPWQERHEIGRVRAFVQTAWLVIRRPTRFARQATRPVRYRDARRFQFVCVLLAWLTIGPVSAWGLWNARDSYVSGEPSPFMYYSQPSGDTSSPSALLADGSIVAAFLVGLFLWLFLTTGVASYFFQLPSLSTAIRDRAIAASYYAAAPLALTPVAGVTVLAMLGVAYLGEEEIWPELIAMWLVVVLFTAAAVLVLVALLATATVPMRFLRRGLHASATRSIACLVTVVSSSLLLFVWMVVGLPTMVFYVQLSWHALRMP